MHNSLYDKIREALEELEAISHPNEEQEWLQEVLRSTTFRAHDGRTRSRLPTRSASHRQENQSQRRSVFEILEPSGSHNRESRSDHSQSDRIEQPRENKAEYPSKQPHGTTLAKTIAVRKEGLNQSIKKPEHMTGFLALQTDLLRYDYLTNSSLQTTPSTMTKSNLGSGSGSTLSQLN
jgi:hypothetical protein